MTHTPLPVPPAMETLIAAVEARLLHRPHAARLFRNCYPNTWTTTVRPKDDGTTFVITGDIPAMWLRDSAAQVRPYLPLARDPLIGDVLAGVVRRQMCYVLHDPYANAFNETADGHGHQRDHTAMTPLLWERKYEVDSLCAPLALGYDLWRITGRTDHLDATFCQAAWEIIKLWRCEQHHERDSSYRFERDDCPPTDTLPREGMGNLVADTGMTWSGFRPSDDACTYGYLVPANMFAVVALRGLAELAVLLGDSNLGTAALLLADEIDAGIREYAVVKHPRFGPIYAYETDGMGHHVLMDDANLPSLLALPYLGYCSADDPLYRNTRSFVLSSANPYYYAGRAAAGVGSPHTPDRYIWHIALAAQGLTATDPTECEHLLDLFETTHANTWLMHEGFHADDPAQYTRPWFAWANAMYSAFVLRYCGLG